MVPFALDSANIADNLCKVEVFYEQFDYESIEESEAYPVIRRTIGYRAFIYQILIVKR